MTQWVPFAIISAEIAKSQAHVSTASVQLTSGTSSSAGYQPVAVEEDEANDIDGMLSEAEKVESEERGQKTVLQAATVMGLQNMAIATPQMAAAVLCSLLYWVLGGFGVVGGEAAGWVIRILQLSSLAAAWLASQI